MRNLIKTFRDDIQSGTDRGKLVRSAGATLALNVGYVLIGFLASLLYARVLGPHDYGLYAYVIACSQVLIIPSSLGLSSYMVREGAKSPQSLLWLLHWGDARTLIAGLIAAALMACAYFIPTAAGARVLFLIAAPLPLLTNLGSVRKALVQAHGWVARSQWPQTILAPGLALTSLAGFWFWRGGFTAGELMSITVLALLPAIAVNSMQLKMAVRDTSALEPARALIRDALPFVWLNGMYLINSRVDVILLGSLRGAREAGVYAIAVRAAELVPYLMTVANLTIAPRVSRLHRDGKFDQLQRLATATAIRVLLVTLPLALVLVFGASLLLDLLYGSSFTEGSNVIRILALSQLVVVGFGPVGVLLSMTKHADLSARAFTVGAVLNIGLNLALIPRFGMIGAALATGISTISSYTLCWYMVRRKLALRPSFFGA